MTVGTFRLPSFPTQDPATYKSNIDAGFMAAQRFMDAFAPHAQTTPNMTVAVDAGFIFYGSSLANIAAQNTAAIAASSRAGITRIDRVVADIISGSVSVITGTSVAPSITAGKFPVAQVAVTTASTAITNAMLTDERAFPVGKGVDYQVFDTTGTSTWTKPVGYSTSATYLLMEWGGGAGGGNTSGDGGGGGGACLVYQGRLSDLPATATVVVGAGGALVTVGGNTSFNGVTVYGGGCADTVGHGGGGGGLLSAGSTINRWGGNPGGGQGGSAGDGQDSGFGGGGGGDTTASGGRSAYGGGGGGGGASGSNGGASVYGGGGGGSTLGAGGASLFGGNGGGGSPLTTAAAPGGGGASNAVGARGEVRVWVFP